MVLSFWHSYIGWLQFIWFFFLFDNQRTRQVLSFQYPITVATNGIPCILLSKWIDRVNSFSIFGVRTYKWPLVLSPERELSGSFEGDQVCRVWGLQWMTISCFPRDEVQVTEITCLSTKVSEMMSLGETCSALQRLPPSTLICLPIIILFKDISASQTAVHYSSNQFMR